MSDFSKFIQIVHETNDKQLLEDFLVGITTVSERQAIVQRIEIVKRLIAGEPHQKIAQDLGVGVATVTRGSKELQDGRFKVMGAKSE